MHWVTGLPNLHLLAQSILKIAGDQVASGNVSVGLLALIEIQVASLQVKVNSLMKGKRK